MSTQSFRVASLAENALAFHNTLYVHEQAAQALAGADGFTVAISPKKVERVVRVEGHASVKEGTVAMATFHRTLLGLSVDGEALLRPAAKEEVPPPAASATLRLTMRSKRPFDTTEEEVVNKIKQKFAGHALHAGCELALMYERAFMLRVDSLGVGDAGQFKEAQAAVLTRHTAVVVEAEKSPNLAWKGAKNAKSANFAKGWKFEDQGIGGLDAEFSNIVRRAFATRVLPPDVVKKMGLQHVKGLLLYGPPGTGKTLIARKIGQMLQGREPKVVNGPEILNKFVGQSEENIRNLFADAEEDQRANGDGSDLHIIIFDELDAICRRRGSSNSGTGVHDTIVNQILSKMDGVERLNNILVIGMTNRKDMIDPALLRPGRMEVHMEISLPDEPGRVQILGIHTKMMRQNGMLAPDVSLEEIAARAKNFSGAELEGLVRSAQSFAINGLVDPSTMECKSVEDMGRIQISMANFVDALEEVEPAFGVSGQNLALAARGGIVHYSAEAREVHERLERAVRQVKTSRNTPLQSVLLEGPSGCGKTALACEVARASGFPFVRVVSPDDLVGLTENGKVNRMNAVFEDAYRSETSIVILDSIERLLEYVPIGPRFSNGALQALWVLCKREPPLGDFKGKQTLRRILIIGTTNEPRLVRDIGLDTAFNIITRVPQVETADGVRTVIDETLASVPEDDDSPAVPADERQRMAEACEVPISVKNLQLVIEMARQHDEGLTLATFSDCLGDVHTAARRKIAHAPRFDDDDM